MSDQISSSISSAPPSEKIGKAGRDGYPRPVDPDAISRRLLTASRRLARDAGALRFGPPVGFVYNPLSYARECHEAYLSKYAAGPKRVVFLGMNPGPWGMTQTGVPFGEISAVRDWLGIHGEVGAPGHGHPRVPVRGFDCTRGEVSGKRLWGFFRGTFGTAERFALENFVSNYCPLMFLDEAGRNVTPDRISRRDQAALFALCDRFLSIVIDSLRPRWLVGIGLFAERRLRAVLEKPGHAGVRVMSITHPSPANPRSQKDWAGQAAAALEREGVWKAMDTQLGKTENGA
jgi:single-strand selective monofunctional uracil DNA glycosylase